VAAVNLAGDARTPKSDVILRSVYGATLALAVAVLSVAMMLAHG
jgi:hypothetical protein